MRLIIFATIFILITAVSCEPNIDRNTGAMTTYVPVYAQVATIQQISVSPATPTLTGGKIYASGQYIFQNDLNRGIHIIDNSVPSNPHKVAFLEIPYSTELAVKGNYLYTNSVSDLLVFNLQNPTQPALVKRVKDAFPMINQEYPPYSGVSFVCPDPSMGIVVDWKVEIVDNPKCRR